MTILYILGFVGQAIGLQVYYYQDDESTLVDSCNCMYVDVINSISTFMNTYHIDKYVITGHPQFCENLKQHIEETLNIEIEVPND